MFPAVHGVCGTADLEIGRGYVKQLQIVWPDRSMPGLSLGLVKPSSEEKSSDESLVDEASGGRALDAQAVLRKERADRERRLEGLAVAVLTALVNATERSATRRGAPGMRCRQ